MVLNILWGVFSSLNQCLWASRTYGLDRTRHWAVIAERNTRTGSPNLVIEIRMDKCVRFVLDVNARVRFVHMSIACDGCGLVEFCWCAYVCMVACVHIREYVRVYIYKYLCMYVCMYVCKGLPKRSF